MLSNIVAGFFCDPEEVAAIKSTGKDACAVFLRGQSAMDGGFTLSYDADEVAEAVNDACEELYGDSEPSDKEDEGEDEDS